MLEVDIVVGKVEVRFVGVVNAVIDLDLIFLFVFEIDPVQEQVVGDPCLFL